MCIMWICLLKALKQLFVMTDFDESYGWNLYCFPEKCNVRKLKLQEEKGKKTWRSDRTRRHRASQPNKWCFFFSTELQYEPAVLSFLGLWLNISHSRQWEWNTRRHRQTAHDPNRMGCSSTDPLPSSSLAVSQTLPSQHMYNLLCTRSLLLGSSTSNSLTGFKFNIKRKTLSKRFSSHDIQACVVNLSRRKMGHL